MQITFPNINFDECCSKSDRKQNFLNACSDAAGSNNECTEAVSGSTIVTVEGTDLNSVRKDINEGSFPDITDGVQTWDTSGVEEHVGKPFFI